MSKTEHRMFRLFFLALFWMAHVVLIVRVWHLAAPEFLLWLSEEQISDIDMLVFASIGGAVGSLMKRSLF